MQSRASRALLALRKGGSWAQARPFHSGQAWAPVAAQVPAAVQPSSPSLLSLFFGKKAVQGPSMFVPFPGVPVVPPLVESGATAETAVTTLSNGLTIASQESPGPSATVGIYVDCGSAWETPFESGASHLLERMAFKSTVNRTHFRVVREIEAIGAQFLSTASREQMAYTADFPKVYLPQAVEMLADTVRNSVFNDWEVKEQVSRLTADVAALQTSNPESLLLEALHSAGFVGALANPLMAYPASLAQLNGQKLFEFVANNYTAPRIVVAGAGVSHDALRGVAEPLFEDMPEVEVPLPPQSSYIGGDVRMAADIALTHLAFGFEMPGGWKDEKDALIAIVFQMLMGGGLSFSAGGPGKGMYTRLYQRVLSKYPDAHSCSSFSSIYNNAGIVGVYGSCVSSFVPNLVDVIINELIAVAKPNGVPESELSRAKNATVAGVLMNLETKAITAEDIGRQILTYGHRKPTQSFVDGINAITTKDITAFAQKIIKTPLTFVAYGDVARVPRFDQISSRFS